MLKLTHLTAGYKSNVILKNVSTEFPSGKLCCIVGKNGCGKSTLLKAIDALIPSQGEIALDDVDISRLTVKERAKLIAYLPQVRPTPCISGKLLIEHGRYPHLDFSKKLRPSDAEIIENAVSVTDTYALLDKNLTEMSGGERQKIYIASALSQETPVLLFDEPTTHLDLPSQIEILGLMKGLSGRGKTVITVLHDIAEAFTFGDYVYVMDNGEILESGTPESVYDSPHIKRIFGVTLSPDGADDAVFKYNLHK